MNILMLTNTYLPMLGGVARSVSWFSEAFRAKGHRVLVVAPTFASSSSEPPEDEPGVVRVPAIQNFNGSDFSVRLPIPGMLTTSIEAFKPQLVHSHHPFLLGETALRVAAQWNIPIVFTHHTMYEQYTHYVPGDSPAMKRFAIRLATEYANLCDHVIAPCESIARILKERGVETQISAIPTGIDQARFARGNGNRARRKHRIPQRGFVVGHVGRLAEEKNLPYLAQAVAKFMHECPQTFFLVVGCGPASETIQTICAEAGVEDRLRLTGSLDGIELADAYRSMNVFAFASKSETQGMVLAEAMTAGAPVIALDAPGTREVLQDGENGYLLPENATDQEFAAALTRFYQTPSTQRVKYRLAARRTARDFTMPKCAEKVLALYSQMIAAGHRGAPNDDSTWATAMRLLEEEWRLWAGLGVAVSDAIFGKLPDDAASAESLPEESLS